MLRSPLVIDGTGLRTAKRSKQGRQGFDRQTLNSGVALSDRWNELPENRRKLLEAGDAAMVTLSRVETVDHWRQVGDALNALQAEAMSAVATNEAVGKAYNAAWASLAAHVPHLRDLDKTTRSHAMWLSAHWPTVEVWLIPLAQNERLETNHPSVIRRKFDRTHKAPSDPPNADGKKGSKRLQLQDHVVKLQEENDALKRRNKGVLLLPNDTPETAADKIADEHAADWMEKLRRALELRIMANRRQDAIEAKAQRK